MKKLKWAFSLALILIFTLCFMYIGNSASATYGTGDKIEDFAITTYDGRTMTLYELLEEKDMVLINIWATWCGPCGMEFPYMEEAYQLYRDDIEIIALSCESTDTDEVLSEYVQSMGMSFPVGRDSADLAHSFGVSGIPTSIVVDRNGVICFVHSGAITDTAKFTRLFDVYVGDSYDEPVILTSIPEATPEVEPAAAVDIAAALDADGQDITFENPENTYEWPMAIAEEDGRSALVSTNAGVENSTGAVYVNFTASAGDAVAVTCKTSTEPVFNTLVMTLNGEKVKVFGGVHDWMTYTIPITDDGDHELCLSYVRTNPTDSNEDTVWIDSVKLLSGSDAEAALAANPVYPVSDVTRIAAVNEGALQVEPHDPEDILESHFGNCEYYVLNATEGLFRIELAADIDPETVIAYSNYDGSSWAVADCMEADGYYIAAPADSIATTGYNYTSLYIFSLPDGDPVPVTATYHADIENLSEFCAGVSGNANGWEYVDEEPETVETISEITEASYVLKFTDSDGNPIAGVLAQVCDDSTCMVYTSDEIGECRFVLAPYEYEMHILKLPDGYSFEGEADITLPREGGEMTFELIKN